jgi:hypothetical protein
MEKVATEAGVSNKKRAENLKAEAKGPTGPLADPPPHHLVEEVEEEAEARDLDPAQNPPATARAMPPLRSLSFLVLLITELFE